MRTRHLSEDVGKRLAFCWSISEKLEPKGTGRDGKVHSRDSVKLHIRTGAYKRNERYVKIHVK